MIRHIVMIKLKDFENLIDKTNAAEEIKAGLEALPIKIEQIKYYEVGLNISTSANAHDLVLVSDFETLETLDEYRVHPAHVEVVNIILKHSAATQVVDFKR